ncbi:MAG TPA: methyltransferase domain-containing protein [Burkholderiales bacterium]
MNREQTRAAWDKIAAGYDEFVTANYFSLGGEALRRAGLSAGMRFLDVACGSGGLSVPAARLGARVLGVDISPQMIECLEARARRERLEIEGRVMDGHALDLPDATFEMTGSQFGVMLFPDLPRGLSEMVRVTKANGRVVLIAFGPIEKAEFFGFFVRAIRAALPGFTGPAQPPLPFQLGEPETFRRRLEAAGLSDVQVESTATQYPIRSGKHLWHWLMNSNPIPSMILAELRLTAAQTGQIRESLDRQVQERADGRDVATLTAAINIGTGTKTV